MRPLNQPETPKTTLGATTSPYVGLRLVKEESLGQQLRRTRPAGSDRKYTVSNWWVAYRYCPPDTEFITSPDAYETQLMDALRAAWNDLAPLLDAALAPAGGPPAE